MAVKPGNNFARTLFKIHGILLIAAWMVLGTVGIFFATWMKPSFPKGQWFQVHRALMLTSLLLVIIGVALAFIATKDNDPPGLILFDCVRKTAHFGIGLTVVALQIINPIIALFRCQPDSSWRYIFNFFHGNFIGLSAQILALINILIGLELIYALCESYITACTVWIYVAWLLFYVIVDILMFIATTIIAIFSKNNNRLNFVHSSLKPFLGCILKPSEYQPVTKNDAYDEKDEQPKDASCEISKDSPLRFTALAVFLTVTLVLAIVLIILIILDYKL